MTAVRSRSIVPPWSANTARVQATAHFCPSSIASLTFGGTGSFHASGSQLQSRTQPPIFEYVLSGALWSSSKNNAGSHLLGSTSVIE